MNLDIDKYEIVSKIFSGSDLKLAFKNHSDTTDRKVLELKNVFGFIDNTNTESAFKILRIDDKGGSYNFDLSLRLQKPEINKYPEVFIFADKACVKICFRAVAEIIDFRNWTEEDKWLT